MSESRKRKSLTFWQYLCLGIATFGMIALSYSFGGSFGRLPLGSLLRFVPKMAENAFMIFVPMVFGAVYSKKKVHPTEAFRFWLIAVIVLFSIFL